MNANRRPVSYVPLHRCGREEQRVGPLRLEILTVARSRASSSEQPLTEIVAPFGSPSCHSREPQRAQNTQRNRRPLSVSRVQELTVPCTSRKSAAGTTAEMPKADADCLRHS